MIKERKRAMCQNSNRTPRLLPMSYDLFHSINAFISIRNTLTSVVLNVKLTNNLNILARQVSCGGYILCVPILLVGTIDYPRVYYRGRVRYVRELAGATESSETEESRAARLDNRKRKQDNR